MSADDTAKQPGALATVFRGGHQKLFGQQWPVWVGGILFGLLNVLLFAYEKPWSAADGVRNWGDWVSNSLGLSEKVIIVPYLYSTSLLNFGIIVGALAAALLAGQFGIRTAPARELFKGLIGGILMGMGASMSFGCNIGGFFSATSALSMAGPMMMLGLLIGALLGLKLLMWEIEYLPAPRVRPAKKRSTPAAERNPWTQPMLGALVFIIGFILAIGYNYQDYPVRGGFLLFGLIIGVIMQRTRFCFVRAFREPFMTGEAETTKAVALAVIIGIIGFAILKWTDLRDRDVFVSPGFWLGSLAGGTIFGIGMSWSGGCATGSLWRAGEGHIKLWVALVGFAFGASWFRGWLDDSGWLMRLGEEVFLPDVVGWEWAMAALIALMLSWYLFVAWNQVKGKFVM